MGISAKIWPATDAEIAACVADRTHVNALFHATRDFATIWGARALHANLEHLRTAGFGLVRVDDSDPTYALASADLHPWLERRATDAELRAVITPELPAVGAHTTEVTILDILLRAAATGRGVMFCIFEDW